MRLSNQRDAIEGIVRATNCHPTADWIYLAVKKIIPNISLGTVYRNLKQLTDSGSIKTIQDGGLTRYDGNINPHYHLKCDECSNITDIQLPEIDFKNDIKNRFDFEMIDVEITITGKCNKHR